MKKKKIKNQLQSTTSTSTTSSTSTTPVVSQTTTTTTTTTATAQQQQQHEEEEENEEGSVLFQIIRPDFTYDDYHQMVGSIDTSKHMGSMEMLVEGEALHLCNVFEVLVEEGFCQPDPAPLSSLFLMCSSLNLSDTLDENEFRQTYKLEDSHFYDNIQILQEMDKKALFKIILMHACLMSDTLLKFIAVFLPYIAPKLIYEVVFGLYYLPTIVTVIRFEEVTREYRQELIQVLVNANHRNLWSCIGQVKVESLLDHRKHKCPYYIATTGVLYNRQTKLEMRLTAREFELCLKLLPPSDTKFKKGEKSTNLFLGVDLQPIDHAIRLGDIQLIKDIIDYNPELLKTGCVIFSCVVFAKPDILALIIRSAPELAKNPPTGSSNYTIEELCVHFCCGEMLRMLYHAGLEVEKIRRHRVTEKRHLLTSTTINNRDILTMEVLFQRPTPILFKISATDFCQLITDTEVLAYQVLLHLHTVRRMRIPPFLSEIHTEPGSKLPTLAFATSPLIAGFLISLYPEAATVTFTPKDFIEFAPHLQPYSAPLNVVGLNITNHRFELAKYILLKYPVNTFLDPFVCQTLATDASVFGKDSQELAPWIAFAKKKNLSIIDDLVKGWGKELSVGGGGGGGGPKKKKKVTNKQKQKENEKEKEKEKENVTTNNNKKDTMANNNVKKKDDNQISKSLNPESTSTTTTTSTTAKIEIDQCQICFKEIPLSEMNSHYDTQHFKDQDKQKKKESTPKNQPPVVSPSKPLLQIKPDPIVSPTNQKANQSSPNSKQINVNKVKVDKKQQQEELLKRYNIVESELDRTVGKFKFSRKEKYIVGRGSNGTLVYMGMWSEFKVPVAIKQMHKAFNETGRVAEEIDLMIKLSNELGSSNMVRYIDKEEDDLFFYLGVSLCDCSLQEMYENPDAPAHIQQQRMQIDKMAAIKDMISGVTFLHQHNVVHNDLNPRNILLKEGRLLISDMGLSKMLSVDSSFSLTHSPTGTGGYHPAEIITGQRKTKSVDIFSLGCLICYVLGDGKSHPFGNDKWMRMSRIMNDQPNVSEALPNANKETIDLISQMVLKNPDSRSTIEAVAKHPFFWTTQQKMVFIDTSCQASKSSLWNGLGITLKDTVDPSLKTWGTQIDKNLLQFLEQNVKKPYNFESVKDLIRCIRNCLQHFQDIKLVNNRQQYFESSETTFQYFDSLFPHLVINLYIKFRSNPNFLKSNVQTNLPSFFGNI
ncbi:putative protein serine/threonine kinase [Cavenderia fasciculata]|uniref:non-specific serine/threonine protein kinase n=1 Tax=Cavenderia fasciculata TaxID=261658 RepID=F4QDN3_CACFS|nr:putative protein serine/threonine kinase [Cavenderia fasciculata]EGG13830.1 putative protein serine/threonine kinase [Cavenderia fasciculata]|eukprot:XP_004350538.1 putative protein serine/threonine kinase [Cavenderia fasciculata]